MSLFPEARRALSVIPKARLVEGAPLADYTRFSIGGPAAFLFDTSDETAIVTALRIAVEQRLPHIIIGGGTNLIVADAGFDGVVLRYTGSFIHRNNSLLSVGGSAVLQDVVDRSIALGLQGLETMTGIPGYLGGAVYGNAGAYGHSILGPKQQPLEEAVLAS
jgi:UDP-N-acetylmuramate dehydrogenase